MNILGAGSHSLDIQAICQRCGIDDIVIFDDDPSTGYSPIPDCFIGPVLLGVNHPRTRRQIVERQPHLVAANPLIDPAAIIGPDVTLGRGVIVAPFVSLLRSVTLNEHVHVNYQSSMTRCNIGAYTTVSPGAVICGDVTIGEACLIGANATICDRVTIGNNVTIAAGAILPPLSWIPDNSRVLGVWKGA